MISIRSLIDHEPKDIQSHPLMRACSLLMEAIALHSASRDEKAHAVFRDGIRCLRQGAEESKSAEEILIITGRIIQLQETNNREVEDFIRSQTKELQEIVRMLSQTLIVITQESAQASENLGQIEKDLESASQVDDLRQLKGRLKDSLQSIVKESARQKENTHAVATRLREQLENVSSDADSLDSVTGLPDSAAAQRHFSRAIAASSQTYAVVMCVERLEAINSRFGYGLGDRLMCHFAQEVAQRLTNQDKLFRWRGPTLVATLVRDATPKDVRIEAGRIVASRHEQVIEWEGRAVSLSISARFLVIPLREASTLESVVGRVNAFVLPPGGEPERR